MRVWTKKRRMAPIGARRWSFVSEPPAAPAEPPVSDPPPAGLTHGSPWSVSGSGFGTKAQAAPFFYDDFTLGADGVDPTGATGKIGAAAWELYPDPSPADAYDYFGYRAGEGRGGKACFKKVGGGDCKRALFVRGLGSLEAYCSYVVKVATKTPGGGIWKWFRMASDALVYPDSAYQGTPSLLGSVPGLATRADWYFVQNPAVNTDTWPAENAGSAFGRRTEWFRVEGYLKLSSALGAADGILQIGDVGHTHTRTGLITRANPTLDATRIGSALMSTESANDTNNPAPDGWTWWVDEFYLDTTRARVELGNADTWSACTQREVQLPTAWSDALVTFTVNKGGLPPGTVWIYVVSSDGVVHPCGAATLL